MKHQTYDLRGLDEKTRGLIVTTEVTAEVDNMLQGQPCSICREHFIGRAEADNAICSGTKPLTFAHEYCWNKGKNNE